MKMIQMEDKLLTELNPSNASNEQNDSYTNYDGQWSSHEQSNLRALMMVNMVLIPIICLSGIIGNTLSTITFLRKPLRNSPCSIYLAIRGISDNGFLCSVLLIWISSTFQLSLSQVKGVCQFIIYVTYLCGCVSVWLCVFITFENFLLIYNPFIAKRICTNRSSRIAIAVLICIAVVYYYVPMWVMHSDCTHDPRYIALTQILVYTDTLVTLVIPTILIFVLLFVISYKIIQRLRRMSQNNDKQTQAASGGLLKYKQQMPRVPVTKVTKMLFIVSLIFFLLNVPSHVIRLRLLIAQFLKGNIHTPRIDAIIQSACQMLYYLSFSVNFLVYVSFGYNFRKTFKKTFSSCALSTQSTYVAKEAVNLVRRRRLSLDGQLNQNHRLLTVETRLDFHSH